MAAGKKGLKKYKGLMLRRINWAEPPEVEGEQQEDAPVNYCELVWEGSVQQPAFERFSVEVSRRMYPVPLLCAPVLRM